MRILTVVKDLGPGGIQRTAENLSRGLSRAGHDVAVLCVIDEGPRSAALSSDGIPVFRAQRIAGNTTAREALDWRADVIHIHDNGPPSPEVRDAVLYLKRRSTDVSIIETCSFGKVDYRHRHDLSDVHLLKSEWMLWKWSRWTSQFRPRPLGVVVPNPVDVSQFYRDEREVRTQFRADHGIPNNAFVFGRVGQPIRWKWSEHFLTAFASVARSNRDVYLLCVGMPRELEATVDRFPPEVKSRIVSVPFLHGDGALRACYSAMDVFLHSAHIGESFGMVLAEAMLCEVPVITLSTPDKDNSQIEVVGEGRGGVVVSSTRSMIKEMQKLIVDHDFRRSLQERARASITERYSVTAITSLVLRIMTHASSASNREQLRELLDNDPELITKVSYGRIQSLLSLAVDRISVRKNLVMHLVHNPVVYRVWSYLKFRR